MQNVLELEKENIRLKKSIEQYKHLYSMIQTENRELKREMERLKKQNRGLGGFVYTPIPDEKIHKVLELRKEGLTYRQISQKVKISKSSVGNILSKSD